MQERTKDKDVVKKYLGFNLKVFALGSIGKPQTAEEMEKRFYEYFNLCMEERSKPYSRTDYGLCTGYHRDSIHSIEIGEYSTHLTDVVKKAKFFIQSYDAILAQNGKIPPIVYIFRGKNFYGMKDVQEIQAGPVVNNAPRNQEEILAAIPDEIPEDFE